MSIDNPSQERGTARPVSEAVRATIRDRATEIRDAELDDAFDRLDAQESLTPAQREILEEMADRIVTTLITPAESVLANHETMDADHVRAVLDLFATE